MMLTLLCPSGSSRSLEAPTTLTCFYLIICLSVFLLCIYSFIHLNLYINILISIFLSVYLYIYKYMFFSTHLLNFLSTGCPLKHDGSKTIWKSSLISESIWDIQSSKFFHIYDSWNNTQKFSSAWDSQNVVCLFVLPVLPEIWRISFRLWQFF